MRLALCVLLSAISLHTVAQPTKYATFWTWFRGHSQQLHAMRSPSDPILDSLAVALSKVHPDLTFEIGPPQARRELVLSADGLRAAFPEVESLAAAAPALSEWEIIRFRPRRQELNTLQLNGQSVDPKRVRFVLTKDQPGKVGLMLIFDGYTKTQHDLFAKAGFLLLDEALGEYDMETRVGAIEFGAPTSALLAQARPLTELAAAFDAWFARNRR